MLIEGLEEVEADSGIMLFTFAAGSVGRGQPLGVRLHASLGFLVSVPNGITQGIRCSLRAEADTADSNLNYVSRIP